MKAVRVLTERIVEEMYAPTERNKFLEVTYARGDKETFYFKDFASGAMIEDIIARAKKIALKRFIAGGEKGLSFVDLQEAVEGEYKENEDLPNTTNPDDWARISGRKGEKIINVRTCNSEGSAGRWRGPAIYFLPAWSYECRTGGHLCEASRS